MPNVCEAISDIGSYSEKQTITIDANNQYLFTKTNLVATQVDVVILSIMGNVGVEDVVLSSRDYSDGTENQYCITKWSKGLFTISCASQNGYFQTADMHFMSPPSGSLGTCTIEFVIKALSPSSVLEKRLVDFQKNVFFDHAIFHPYYESIVDCYIKRISITQFSINVVDKAGIVSETTLNVQGASVQNHETVYGMLFETKKSGLFFTSVGESVRLRVMSRFDVAPTSRDYYPMLTIQTDRWFPTYNGFFKLNKTNGSTNIPLVDNKDGFDIDGKDIQFFYLFLKDLFPNSKNSLDKSFIQTRFLNAINNGHRRIGLVFCPTTEGSTNDANCINVGGVNVYYHFPTWMLTDLNQHATYKPYIFDRIDTYTYANIKMYNLDWRDQYTRNLYKECIQAVVDYLNSSPSQLFGKTLYSYIDVVKVAFAGTWGEGTTLNTINYPTANQLTEISNYISDTLFPDKLCLRSLMSALNADFPEGYRSLILNPENPKRMGIFYDGAGQEPCRYFYDSINTYTASTPELMNRIYNYVKGHPCYIECAKYDNETNVPNYCSIGAFAKYFRPYYYNLFNIAFDVLQSEMNLQRVIRQTSDFVGYRPYILINKCTLSNNQVVKINITIGNFGTASFLQSYWKLHFYAKVYSSNGTYERQETYVSNFDLSTIPSPFEVGVPNYHDTIKWSENWSLSQMLTSGKRFYLLVAIEDSEGIFTQPIWFCNDETSLPREYIGTTPTGKFFLIQDLQCT